jgi:phage terminase large subunit-like protein
MVETTIRSKAKEMRRPVNVKVVTASRGKAKRAEPVAALYERGKVHHVGRLPALEDEMTTWVPGESTWSPNRMDAAVWALTELMLDTSTHSMRLGSYR